MLLELDYVAPFSGRDGGCEFDFAPIVIEVISSLNRSVTTINWKLEVDLPSSFSCYSTLISILLTVIVGLFGACPPEV